MILLITESNKLLGFGIAFFFLMLGVSIIAYAIRTAECYDDGPADVLGEYTDVSYVERPYIPADQYN
jgi:hypothetical protein